MSWAYEPGGPYHRETPAGHGDGTKPGGENEVNSEHVIAEKDHHDTIFVKTKPIWMITLVLLKSQLLLMLWRILTSYRDLTRG